MDKRKCKCKNSGLMKAIEGTDLTVLTGGDGVSEFKEIEEVVVDANIGVWSDGKVEIEMAAEKAGCLLYIKFPYCPLCGGRLNG